MPENTILKIISQSVQNGTCFISLFLVCHVLCSLERPFFFALSHLQPIVRQNSPGQRKDGKVGPSLRVMEHAQLGKVSCAAEERHSAESDCDGHGKEPTARGQGRKATPLRMLNSLGV